MGRLNPNLRKSFRPKAVEFWGGGTGIPEEKSDLSVSDFAKISDQRFLCLKALLDRGRIMQGFKAFLSLKFEPSTLRSLNNFSSLGLVMFCFLG